MKKWLLIVALAPAILGCGELWKLVPIDPGNKPVILNSYAPENLRPGAAWKIYIEAQDKDDDMKDIVTAIAPAAGSFLSFAITSIREEERGSFSGYLFVNTPLAPDLQGEKFTVTIFIRDKAGRRSERIGFLLQFSTKSDTDLPEKWQEASSNRLGGMFSDYLTEYVRLLTSSQE